MNSLKYVLITVAIVLAIVVLAQPSNGYVYNETNITAMQEEPIIPLYSNPVQFDIENGTGSLILGYVPTYSRVVGVDIVIQQLTAITIILGIIGVMVAFYVGLYLWRYITKT